jgi:hypothetical protein
MVGMLPEAGPSVVAISPAARRVFCEGNGAVKTKEAGNADGNMADSRLRAGSALLVAGARCEVLGAAQKSLFVWVPGGREPGEPARMMEIGSTLAEADMTSDRGTIVRAPIAEAPAIAARERYFRRWFGLISVLTATLTQDKGACVEA